MIVLCFLFLVIGCTNNAIFEHNVEIPDKEWTYENAIPFDVHIADTSQLYNVFLNVRHTNSYQNMNLWVLFSMTFPDGEVVELRKDLPLANKEGDWYGKGSGDIVSTQWLVHPNTIFPDTGIYRFEVAQDMRLNPLKEVMDVGLRVEQVVNP